jgi:hypothetical protein
MKPQHLPPSAEVLSQPIAWRVRPYEGDKWLVTTEPPTEEQRRYMEFVPIYEFSC